MILEKFVYKRILNLYYHVQSNMLVNYKITKYAKYSLKSFDIFRVVL